MYKYQDLVSGHAQDFLDNGAGAIDKKAFIDWWFAPLEVVRPEMAEPQEEIVES